MSDACYTLRVDETLVREFFKAAEQSGQNGAQLLREYMREVVRQHDTGADGAGFRYRVHIGLDSANAGNLFPATDVEATFAAKRAATRRRLQSSG